MRDKDAIILESLYQIISEGAKEVIEKLKAMGIDDNTVERFIAADITAQKNDARKLGAFLKAEDKDADYLLKLYGQFVKFKKKNASQTKDLGVFKKTEDLDKVLSDLNGIETLKILARNREQATRLLRLDNSPAKIDSVTLAKMIIDMGGGISPQEAVNEYEKYARLKENNVQGTEDITQYPDYLSFANFVHAHEQGNQENKKEEKEEEREIVGSEKIAYKPVYHDDDIAIWSIDSVQESLNVGKALIDLAEVKVNRGYGNWCTTWPIVAESGSLGTNMFVSYRTNYKWSFYYTWSKKRKKGLASTTTANDPYIITAIGKKEGGRYSFTPAPNGTKMDVGWNDIVKNMPELEGKEEYFVYKPLSQKQASSMNLYDRIARYFNERDFLNLSELQQYEYISMEYDIPSETVLKISPERRNDYLNILARNTTGRRKIPMDLIKKLSPKEVERFNQVRQQSVENYLLGIDAPLDAF